MKISPLKFAAQSNHIVQYYDVSWRSEVSPLKILDGGNPRNISLLYNFVRVVIR